MAEITIGGQRWPDGTVVSVFPAAARVGAAAPSGPVVETATVSGGAVTFNEVLESVRYVAYALGVGVSFVVPAAAAGGDRARIEALEARVAELGGVVTEEPRSSGMWVDLFRLANGGTPEMLDVTQTANRFKYVVLNVWERTHLANLKAANPDCLGLAYQNAIYHVPLLAAANGFQSDAAGAISTEEADDASATVDWYVKNSSAKVANPSGSGDLLRVNLPELQAAWASNVAARARAGTVSWDGIFADDINYDVGAMTSPFTTDWTWYKGALRPLLTAVTPVLRSLGLMLVGNHGSAGERPWMADLFPLEDGYCEEFWQRFPGGSANAYWYHSILMAEKAVASGHTKAFLSTPGSSAADVTSFRAGLAAALLVTHETDPSRVAFAANNGAHSVEVWDASFALPVGPPTGARQWTGTAAQSALVRYFENGVAVYNPLLNPASPHGNGAARSSVMVDLAGGSYSGSGRTAVSNVTLAAGEGAVLIRA